MTPFKCYVNTQTLLTQLCVKCYVKDLKLAKEFTNNNSSNINSVNNDNDDMNSDQMKKKLSLPEALSHIFSELGIYKAEYDEAHKNPYAVEEMTSTNQDGSDSDDMYD
jgi:hypothetical protein